MAGQARHVKARPWRARLAVAGAVVVVAAGVAVGVSLAGSGGSSSPKMQATTAAPLVEKSPVTVPKSAIRILPAIGSANLPLDTVVSVATPLGHLKSVTVATSGGSPLPGVVAAGGQEWQSAAGLQPSASYRVTAVVSSPDGKTVTKSSSFTTLTPTETLGVFLSPDQKTVGVGEPITVVFDHPVVNQTAVENALHVSMSQPVPGGWHWFSSTEVHFRPTNFWPPNEHVHLDANLLGVDAGNGIWGVADHSIDFTVGDSHIATANLVTDQMTVTDNGAVVATYPISGGSNTYPTMNGVHLVIDKAPVVHMVSSTVGIPVNSPAGYDELVYWDVHISDSGEYVHAAPWSVAAQGSTNVSHGCINVSPTNAQSFYNFTQVGDIVVVDGSPRPPVPTDGGEEDWQTPANEWTAASIGTIPGSTSVTTTTAASSPTTAAAVTTTAAPTTTPATTATTTAAPTTAAPTTSAPTTAPVTSAPTTSVPGAPSSG